MCTNLGSICHTCIVKEFCFFVASATFHVRRRELTRSSGLQRWMRLLFLTLTFSSDRVTLQKSESRLPASSIQRVASSLSGQMTNPAWFVRLEWNHLAASRRTIGLCVSSWTCWYHFACRDLIFWNRCPASLPHGSVRFFKMTAKAVQNARQGLFLPEGCRTLNIGDDWKTLFNFSHPEMLDEFRRAVQTLRSLQFLLKRGSRELQWTPLLAGARQQISRGRSAAEKRATRYESKKHLAGGTAHFSNSTKSFRGSWRPDPSQHQNDGIVLQICLVDAGSGGQGLDGALSQSSLGRVPSSPKTRCYVSLRGNRREAACSNLQGVMLSLVIVSITSVSLEEHTKKLLETNIARIRAALRIITHIHSSSTSHSLRNIRKLPWCGQRPNSWLCRRRRVQYTVPYLTSVLYALAQTNSVLFGFCDGAIVAALAERSH